MCGRCANRFFVRLHRNDAGILAYCKEFLCDMAENSSADAAQSRQVGFVRYCLNLSPHKKSIPGGCSFCVLLWSACFIHAVRVYRMLGGISYSTYLTVWVTHDPSTGVLGRQPGERGAARLQSPFPFRVFSPSPPLSSFPIPLYAAPKAAHFHDAAQNAKG